ncbi:unnamed protein product, partial [Allacma fusca]
IDVKQMSLMTQRRVC